MIEYHISVNEIQISISQFQISVNEFWISENNLNFRYRKIVISLHGMLAIRITIAYSIHSCLGFSFRGVFVSIVLLKINYGLNPKFNKYRKKSSL